MKTSLVRRMLLALMQNRFEPIETVLSASAIVHGLWLLFPEWSTQAVESALGASRLQEVIVAVLFIVVGSLSFVALAWRLPRLLLTVDFLEFVGWTFFAALAISAAGLTNILWIPYATLSLLAAFVYLGLSIGGMRGVD